MLALLLLKPVKNVTETPHELCLLHESPSNSTVNNWPSLQYLQAFITDAPPSTFMQYCSCYYSQVCVYVCFPSSTRKLTEREGIRNQGLCLLYLVLPWSGSLITMTYPYPNPSVDNGLCSGTNESYYINFRRRTRGKYFAPPY